MENSSNKKQKTFITTKDARFREFALNANLWTVLFHVCTPLAAYAFLNAVFNILDTMMASHISSTAVSAVAYLSQVKSIIGALGGGLAAGGSLKLSEAYGAGDYDTLKKRLSTLVFMCGILSAVILLMMPFTGLFLRVTGTPDEYIEIGTQYFAVTLLSLVFNFFNTVYISIERARGKSGRIMTLNLIVIVIKLAITAVAIYGFNGGVVMIAWATVVSQLFLFVIALVNLLKGQDAFAFSLKSVSMKKDTVGPITKISYPVIIEKMAFAFGKTVVNSMCKTYGPTTVGALGISNNMDGLVTQIQIGFQDGGAAVISQNLGGGRKDRAIGAFYRLVAINAGIGLIGLILLNVFVEPVSALFANAKGGYDREFQELIIHIFRYEAFGSCIQLGIYDAVMALLFGFKKTKLVLFTNVLRVFLFRIPVLWALQNFTSLGSECAGIIMAVSNSLTMICGVIVAFFVIRKEKKSGLEINTNK
ncbi:MAG: MATE family efflux transporter [Lachnospiraceae bacterium]|nr:MATE family efflux transporter [Lachnospiraceae bacterium]